MKRGEESGKGEQGVASSPLRLATIISIPFRLYTSVRDAPVQVLTLVSGLADALRDLS